MVWELAGVCNLSLTAEKKQFYYVCLALPLPRRAQCHKMEPLSLRGTTFCFQMIILAFFPDLRPSLATFSPPNQLAGGSNLSLLKKSELSCAFGTPPAEEGPVSQDGTSFRGTTFFSIDHPCFFRFVALFGHFFPNQLANLSLLKKTFPLPRRTRCKKMRPCMEICIQITNHQGCFLENLFQMV